MIYRLFYPRIVLHILSSVPALSVKCMHIEQYPVGIAVSLDHV